MIDCHITGTVSHPYLSSSELRGALQLLDVTTQVKTPLLTATVNVLAASSAFPGFIPPLLLTAADVGAEESQFPPHLVTDGEVYQGPLAPRRLG